MKFKNKAEALPAPPPAPTTIHNHAPSAFGAVFSKVLAGVVGSIFFWFAGVFLFKKIGFRHPDEAMAMTIFIILAVVGLLLTGAFIFDRFLDRWFEFQKAMRDKETEQMRYRRMLLQSAVADTRPTGGEQTRLNSLILQIMDEAYTYLAKNGRFRGAWRPWSRRNAGTMVLIAQGEREPVGETLAVKAKTFLTRHEVIVDEQVNLERYPDLASIQKLLYAPILLPVTDKLAQPAKIIRGKFQ